MKRLASLGLGTLLLTGCVSVLPDPVVPDALYRLRVSSSPIQGEPVRLSRNVTVYEPDGSTLLLGKGVVFEDEAGGLSVMRKAQWSDPASRLLQNLLLDRLSIRAPDSEGMALSEQSGAAAPVELHWQARDFFVRDGNAIATFRVTLLTGRSRQVVGQFEVRRVEAYSGRDDIEGVAALIRASQGAVDEIAMELPALLDQSELMAESNRR